MFSLNIEPPPNISPEDLDWAAMANGVKAEAIGNGKWNITAETGNELLCFLMELFEIDWDEARAMAEMPFDFY